MRRYCLLLLMLFGFTLCRGVEPWSGIGVAFFRCHHPITTEKSIDLDIFDSTLTTLIMTINSRNYYTIKGLELIEFADDVKGFCIVSIQENSIKVILNNSVSPVQYGWLKKDNKDIDYYLWSSLIPYQKSVFPINNNDGIAQITFYKMPNGDTLDLHIPLMKERWYDYKNQIIRVFDCDIIPTRRLSQKTWMQVDISYPHDEGEDIFECFRIRCWIRFLDDYGRPLVWYNTRD